MNTAWACMLVVVLASGARPGDAAILQGRDPGKAAVRGEYLNDLSPDIVNLLRETLPEIRDIRFIDGPDGPRLDMPLSGCRDSRDCHFRFTNYLGLLVRMMETGKRRK